MVKYLEQHIDLFKNSAAEFEIIKEVGTVVSSQILKNKSKLLIAGNGGSAADAQHFAAEIVGRFETERRAYPAIALTTDTSAITAISNDYGFEALFERQIEALGRPGDVFFGISTSGSSENILRAAEKSREIGMITILLTSLKYSNLFEPDHIIKANTKVTSLIQEFHIFAIHTICKIFDEMEQKL